MPQRDSWVSALAPRLSPKARGLSKTHAGSVSDASRGIANNLGRTQMHSVLSGAFLARPADRLYSAC